jgi:hypothetical protein
MATARNSRRDLPGRGPSTPLVSGGLGPRCVLDERFIGLLVLLLVSLEYEDASEPTKHEISRLPAEPPIKVFVFDAMQILDKPL